MYKYVKQVIPTWAKAANQEISVQGQICKGTEEPLYKDLLIQAHSSQYEEIICGK